jgi:eukaryotic-like serine/threonine-protein kinase
MPRSDFTDVARKRGTPASDTARVGVVLDGRYRLEALIGRGGMGVVYRAAHIELRKQVAIKVLHPSLASSPEVRSRFEREALAIGKIDHPNCVGVFDLGTMEDGARYLVMELLDGKSLGDVLDEQGQLAPTRALHILKHILSGLSHIHQVDLVHRDIKPENIYLVTHGNDRDFAKILDFGIAKPMKSSDLNDGVKLTQAGVAFGTPIYMSPEQAIGNPIDGRADLYSTAALGFEMLTGQPPFYSDDKLEVMSMHTTRPTPMMSSRLIKGGTPVSESIEQVIAKGLAKRPNDRYQSAEEFISALNDLMEVGGATEIEIRPLQRITGSQPLAVANGAVTVDSSLRESNRPIASRPLALPGVAPLPGDLLAPSSSNSGVLVRAAARVTAVPDIRPEHISQQGRPWWVYAAAAVLATAIGIGGATITMPRDKKLKTAGPVAAAAQATQAGHPEKAQEILEANLALIAKDPIGQLELGHARAGLGRNLLAIVAYDQALKLAPELQSGVLIRRNLLMMSEDKAENERDQEVVERAFDLLMKRFDLLDTEKRLLATTTDPAASWLRRQAAISVVKHFELEKKLDWVAVYSIDLEQAPTCKARKAAVGNLRLLADPRALEALQKLIKRSDSTPKAKGKGKGKNRSTRPKPHAVAVQRDNLCLVEETVEAIAYLQSLIPQNTPAELELLDSSTP